MESLFGVSLEKFAVKVRTLGEEAFTARYNLPAVVIETDASQVLPRTFDTQGGTVLSTGNPPPAPGTGTQFVQFLQKTDRNAMKDKVTIGRSNNNDIIILHNSVSKFHAYFDCREGIWTLTDMGSTNGTFLDGKRIHEGQHYPARSGNVLRFGGVAAYFFTSKGFYDYTVIYRKMKGL